jgi:hypothetical protein
MSLIAGGIGLQFTAVAKDIPEHALLCSAVTMRCSMVSTSVTDDNTEGLMGAMYACNSSDSTHPQNADACTWQRTRRILFSCMGLAMYLYFPLVDKCMHLKKCYGLMTYLLQKSVQSATYW